MAGRGLSTFAEAAAGAELVVNASGGDVALGILERAGAENLARQGAARHLQPAGRLDGVPAAAVRQGRRLAGRAIQRAHPDARVVKSAEHDDRTR